MSIGIIGNDFMAPLKRNGWDMVKYSGSIRNAPRNLAHVFRDLKAGSYLVRDSEILVNEKNEVIRFPDTLVPFDYEVAWFSVVLLEAIKGEIVFVEKVGSEYIFIPEIPAYNLTGLLRSKPDGFYAYDRNISALVNTQPHSYLQSLLLELSETTSYAPQSQHKPMDLNTSEIQLLVSEIKEKIELLEYNINRLY